jgi:hypothetical protein
MELRCGIYKSPDRLDHPEKLQFTYEPIAERGRVTGDILFAVMKLCKTDAWKNGRPDMVGVDDIALMQEVIYSHWANKEKALEAAKLYGKSTQRCFTSQTWKSYDPGTISVFKDMIGEWFIDMRALGIAFVSNTKMHNIWSGYGEAGYAEDGKPKMRIEGKSVKMLDVFQQHADVVWVFNRTVTKAGMKSLKAIPDVKMDLFIPKASLPGIPEQFDWPGWVKLWEWHNARTFTADVSKLTASDPTIDSESMERTMLAGKSKAMRELKDAGYSVEDIRTVTAFDYAIKYDYETAIDPVKHTEFVTWCKKELAEYVKTKPTVEADK